MKRLKVGVITMHRVYNYGSVLQAYATQTVIERLGHECEIIDYQFLVIINTSMALENRKKS